MRHVLVIHCLRICSGQWVARKTVIRIYSLKTEALKLKPIPATVRLSGRVFLVEYTSQPIQCFVCKQFGHIRYECPNYSPAKLPPAKEPGSRDPQEPPDCAISEGASSNSASHGEDQPKATSETSGTKDDDGYTLVKRTKTRRVKKLTLQTLFQNINSPSASNGMDAAQAVNQVTHDQDPEPSCTEDSCRLPTSTPRVTTEPCSITDEVNPILPTSTEDDVDGEQIDDAATAEGNPPVKRLFSPDTSPECAELVKRGRTNILNCYCGLKMIKPAKTGELVTCECSSQYMLCVCQHVFKIGEKGEAVCNSCHRQMPMLGLDMTV